jgi:hypothetical protein
VDLGLLCEVSRSHSDTPHSVRLRCMSDQAVAGTSTWQHTTRTKGMHPCPRWDSKLQASRRRHALDCATSGIGSCSTYLEQSNTDPCGLNSNNVCQRCITHEGTQTRLLPILQVAQPVTAPAFKWRKEMQEGPGEILLMSVKEDELLVKANV